ncbi:MAG: hypothetical protein ACOH2F_06780 [Cellulomonas sp.]
MRHLDVGLWWRLGRKFLRTRSVRRSAGVVGGLVAALMATYVVLHGFALSAEQKVERNLGRFDASVSLVGIPVRDDDTMVTEARDAALSAGASDVVALLETYDMRPSIADAPFVAYREGPWQDGLFPDRYALVDGRWPTAPGEVVLTEHLIPFVSGDRLSVLSGAVDLRVVGTVRDGYGRRLAQILAGPGTWASLDWASLNAKQPRISTAGTVLWAGNVTAGVLDAIAPVVLQQAGPDGQPWVLPAGVNQALRAGLTTRPEMLAAPARGPIDLYPLVFTVPSLLLPALGALVALGVNNRRVRRSVGILRAVGLRSRDAAMGRLTASLAALAVAALGGVLAGGVLGLLARPVAQIFMGQPLSPVPDLLVPALRLMAAVAVAALVGCLVVAANLRTVSARLLTIALPSPRVISFTRQVLAAITATVLIWQAANVTTLFGSMPMVATTTVLVLLLTPPVVQRVVAWLPGDDAQRRLARRQMRFDHTRVVVAVTIIVATLGPALAMLVLVQSALTSQARAETSLAPQGQAIITSGNRYLSPPDGVVAIVTGAARSPQPSIQLWSPGTQKRTTTMTSDGLGAVYAVDTVAEIQRLCQQTLSNDQLTQLASGSLLRIFGPRGDAPQPLWSADATTGAASPTRLLRTIDADCDPTWQRSVSGLILSATIRNLGLDMTPADVVLTDLPSDSSARIKGALIKEKYDTAYVSTYNPVVIAVPPEVLTVIVAMWLFGGIAIFASSRAQAGALRRYTAGLIAIGVPTRWARGVLTRQTVTTTLLGFVLAAVVATIPLLIAGIQVPTETLVIPWITGGSLFVVAVVLAATAPRLASTRLRVVAGVSQ